MKKLIGTPLMVFALILGMLVLPAQAASIFSDVSDSAWYADDVESVQQYGIINGTGNGKFSPNGNLTLAEAITMAARTHAHINGETISASSGSTWYTPYLRYADENDICSMGEFGANYNGSCNRLTMAKLFERVVPKGSDVAINNVASIPDVQNNSDNAPVFHLYQLGVLTGSDEYGTFYPYKGITRAETAAILHRVLEPDARKVFAPETTPDGNETNGEDNDTPTQEPAPEKPYEVNTLARNVTISHLPCMLTMDSEDNLIYYDEGEDEILFLDTNGGKTEVLLDVSDITYAADGTTYEDLEIIQVFWSDLNQQLLVIGTFNNIAGDRGWISQDGGSLSYSAVFTLDDGDLDYYAEIPTIEGHSRQTFYLTCELNNGYYIIGYHGASFFGDYYWLYDLERHSEMSELGSFNSFSGRAEFMQYGQDIYCFWNISIYQYNWGTGRWDELTLVNYDASAGVGREGLFYTWSDDELRVTRVSDGAYQVLFHPSEDVSVSDMRNLPKSPTNLYVTSDGCLIFYDRDNQIIRMISPT